MNIRPVLLSVTLLLALLSGCSQRKQAGEVQTQSARSSAAQTPIVLPSSSTPTQVAQEQPDSADSQVPAAPDSPSEPAPFQELNLASLSQRVPVLTYHGVIASRDQQDAVWFDCTLEEFEAQMQFLQEQGANVITLEQLRQHLTSGEPLPGKAIALTFDDSYQGVYDYAMPVLQRYGYPYAVFVHTDYVGSQKGRPKMSWSELRELDRSKLATIGSHSRSHPADMGLLSQAQQDEELQGSKKVLEQELGHAVSFVSYPNGKADAATFERAKTAGYTLGFMEEWGPVQQSPGILALGRYIHLQLPRAWAENYGPLPTLPMVGPLVGKPASEGLEVLPAGRVLTLHSGPLHVSKVVAAGVPITLTSGGTLRGQLPRRLLASSDLSSDFVPSGGQELNLPITSHAAGGAPLGPYQAQDGAFTPEQGPDRLTLIQGRPLVAWNAGTLAFLPFAPGLMNDDAQLRALLPGLQGVFVAGAWLVQDGQAMSSASILSSGTSDLRTLRRRVFLGVAAGEPLLGVTNAPVTARQLALAAAEAGAQNAVLLY